MVDTKVPLSSICHKYNLYITLRCEIVPGQAGHKLTDAPQHRYKEKRSRSAVSASKLSLRLLLIEALAILMIERQVSDGAPTIRNQYGWREARHSSSS